MLNAAPTEVQALIGFGYCKPLIVVFSKFGFRSLLAFFSPQTVKVAVFYSKPQRLDVYVNDLLVAPNNAQWNVDKTDYTLLKPTYPGTVISKSQKL